MFWIIGLIIAIICVLFIVKSNAFKREAVVTVVKHLPLNFFKKENGKLDYDEAIKENNMEETTVIDEVTTTIDEVLECEKENIKEELNIFEEKITIKQETTDNLKSRDEISNILNDDISDLVIDEAGNFSEEALTLDEYIEENKEDEVVNF